MNYYEILRVSQQATKEELKKSYHELVRKYHPDKSTSSTESNEEFLKIDKAYKVLTDKSARKIYDSEQFLKSTAHLIIHDTISRNQFSFDEEENIYHFQCKCGSYYVLENADIKEDVILSCDECSLNIMVKN